MALVVLRGLPTLASAVANWAGLELLRTSACDPDWFVCLREQLPYPPLVWQGNRTDLETIGRSLFQVLAVAPESEASRRRLAEVEFALGQRTGAAQLMPDLGAQPPRLEIGGIHPAYATPLAARGHYQYYLMAAHQSASQDRWDQAAGLFRWAMALAPDYMTQVDANDYLAALAQSESQQSGVAHSFLAAHYFTAAGRWTDANDWLARTMRADDWDTLTAEQQAATFTDWGLVQETAGDSAAALAAYERASEVAPTINEPLIRLTDLLYRQSNTDQANQVATLLAARGPAYHLIQSGDPSQALNGLRLVGYDMDEHLLEAGGQIELWLWWQLPTGVVPSHPDRGFAAGQFWIQLQSVINLAPNPGFEWGGSSETLPLGYLNSYETDRSGNVLVSVETDGSTGRTQVLQLISGGQAGVIGIKTVPLISDSAGIYLAGGWFKPSGGLTKLGRECFAVGDVDYSVAQSRMGNPPLELNSETLTLDSGATDRWTYVAGLLDGDSSYAIQRCHFYIEQKKGLAEFDQILFAHLDVP